MSARNIKKRDSSNQTLVADTQQTTTQNEETQTQAVVTNAKEQVASVQTFANVSPSTSLLGSKSGNITVDVSKAPATVVTPTGPLSITFTGFPPSGVVSYWEVELVNPKTTTVIFNKVTWDGAKTPTFSRANYKTVLTFRTRDGGATIYGGVSFGSIA